MRVKLIRIGNSKGIRLPKYVIEQTGLEEEAEMEVQENGIHIYSPHKPRQGWDKAFSLMAENNDDKLLDKPTSTKFDNNEWEWK